MDQHLLLGLVCCALLVVFFLTQGQKKDAVSWLALLVGIVIILLVCTHWSTIAQWWPASVTHAAIVSTPAPLHSSVQGMSLPSVTQGAAVPGTRHPSAAPNSSLASLMDNYAIAVLLLVALVLLVVALVFARAKRQPHSHALHTRSVCMECFQQGQMRQYRYQKGRTRLLGRLCQQCATRLQATLA